MSDLFKTTWEQVIETLAYHKAEAESRGTPDTLNYHRTKNGLEAAYPAPSTQPAIPSDLLIGKYTHCTRPDCHTNSLHFHDLHITGDAPHFMAASIAFKNCEIEHLPRTCRFLGFFETRITEPLVVHQLHDVTFDHSVLTQGMYNVTMKRCTLRSTLTRLILDSHIEFTRISRCNLSFAELRGNTFVNSQIDETDLSNSALRHSKFSGTPITRSTLRQTNFSGSKGFTTPSQWMNSLFAQHTGGYIVYKAIGGNTTYPKPNSWTIAVGSQLEEAVNPDVTIDCASGISFGTLGFVLANYFLNGSEHNRFNTLWRCRIPWDQAANIITPYMAAPLAQKARTASLTLLEPVGYDRVQNRWKKLVDDITAAHPTNPDRSLAVLSIPEHLLVETFFPSVFPSIQPPQARQNGIQFSPGKQPRMV